LCDMEAVANLGSMKGSEIMEQIVNVKKEHSA
jgi:hypothetical protein